MYYVAAMWLVYRLGGSAFYSGLAGFLILLPQAFQFLIGPAVDRYQIRKLLIVSQMGQAVLLSLIPIAYFSGVLAVWMILTVMPFVSFLDQFSFPAEQALIPRIVAKEDRVAANSWMSLAYQGTDTAFNAVGGAVLLGVGTISLYLADIVTFLFAAWLFKMLVLPKQEIILHSPLFRQQVTTYFRDLKDGFRVVLHSVLGRIIVTGTVTNFTLGALTAILPAYADSLGGSESYGFLLAGSAAGSLTGAAVAPVFSRLATGRLLIVSYFLGFCFWLLSVFVPSDILKVLCFSASMLPLGLNNVIGYTLMQNVAPRHLLARSTSVMVSIATCTMPLGSLCGGALGNVIGPTAVFLAASGGFLFIAIYVLMVPVLRRLPASQKIKPENFGFKAEG